jgi:uncharacterized protein
LGLSALVPLLDAAAVALASGRPAELGRSWHEIDPTELVRETAARFVRVHPLRSADALQLAAAFVAAEGRPPSMELVTLDEEGFVLV